MSRPERIFDHSSPQVAADSYHKWREDVEMVKEMGVDHYRLSIAWARIYPDGYKTEEPNARGVAYYKNLLRSLRALGIEPMVTLYHWDLPQKLQDDFGGWLSPKIVDIFADYARTCFELFGDEVKWWITINEPKQICEAGYGTGVFAPGIVSPGVGNYKCAKNVLLAHAKAYHIYDKEFRKKNQGKVAIVIDSNWFEPLSAKDEEASERALQFSYGLYGNPVFNGDWPAVVKERVAQRSKQAGLKESRLPALTKEEIKLIKGTHDFLCINHYTSHMVSAWYEAPVTDTSFAADIGVNDWMPREWPRGGEVWFSVWAPGMRKLLNWLKNTYNNPEIVITENGLSDNTGTLEDDHRINYYRDYLSNCLDAIYIDNVNLTGYTAWSILDDWEWSTGYHSLIGMYKVDFNDPNRARIPRKSVAYFTQIAKNRCLAENPAECID
ncbi:unnamed protein product [Acanthoscelides obtectus]|uniref:beta-glucosidase n=1 Tax=Acanthoscelides obtectus TaxID=200917 RepID=A0A9P0KDP0_ACAOB|nr:unnamed protein product [Acanthoscelides obtectus]CAK1656691.1 hypothetical protein AOBTE_LOCUS19869 [Acanthoscelides obtectus]